MQSRNSRASNSCIGSRSNWQFVTSSSTPAQYTIPASTNARKRSSFPTHPGPAGTGGLTIRVIAPSATKIRNPGKFSANTCMTNAGETAPLRASAAMRKSDQHRAQVEVQVSQKGRGDRRETRRQSVTRRRSTRPVHTSETVASTSPTRK